MSYLTIQYGSGILYKNIEILENDYRALEFVKNQTNELCSNAKVNYNLQ